MKKKLLMKWFWDSYVSCRKIFLIMRFTLFLFFLAIFQTLATNSYSQVAKVSLDINNKTVIEILNSIEDQTDYYFLYNNQLIDVDRLVSFQCTNENIETVLDNVFKGTDVGYLIKNRQIILSNQISLKVDISGTVTDQSGSPLPGVTVLVKGTTQGTISDADGNYSLTNVQEDVVLIFSFVGMKTQEIPVLGKTTIDVILKEETIGLEEVVAIGYGTMRKRDLTGSVQRANIESFAEQPNISVIQSLQGAVPGLNVGQVNSAGQEPVISVRGATTISGETAPLIVLDGVIFRGNIIDLNPSDIESVDILKDASSTAVYGSQAANGVIIITTSKSGGKDGKPVISLSSQFSFQRPHKTYEYPDADYFEQKTIWSDFYQSMTEESGYLEVNPNYSFTNRFNTVEESRAYENGILNNWYNLVTRDNPYTQSHNLSLSNSTEYNDYYISIGYSDQVGYMLNEDYERINARINVDNKITDWLTVGIQSFLSGSDYSGAEINPKFRYEHNPYVTVYDQHGEYVTYPGSQYLNPLLTATDNDLDKRLSISGNIYTTIDFPFIKGLSYKFNFNNTYISRSEYGFSDYGSDLRGSGSKMESKNYDWTSDNIISFKRTFKNIHDINATLLYGVEKRSYTSTYAGASDFINSVLGYNRLQAGNAELAEVSSSAWEEASIYQMARLFYGYNNKYLFTGTIRRDGFSGFSKNNKTGIFPSAALAWILSRESFINNNFEWIDNLKARVSYGSNGNRTISRYQTLASVEGGFNYVTADESSVYTQSVASMASPNLNWETTTGINIGLDFGLFDERLFGAIDYYNNNTNNLLYNVDIPAISRYTKFPDNLGKLHNHGIDLSFTTINIKRNNLTWMSTFNFSRNRNELKELLGFDNDGDGKEDDLVSEGLFIGESLSAIYTYQLIPGEFWEIGEELPLGFGHGSYKIEDITGEGEYTPDDRKIIGNKDPSYRFSINNEIRYNNWTLKVFINSIQGGKDFYYGIDDLSSWNLSESVFRRNLPKEINFWYPGNPNPTYHAVPVTAKYGDRWIQRNFVRLQDVSLSYNLPGDVLKNLNIQRLKVYISGKNLATWTNWPGWDPETGDPISRDGRPVMSSFTLGLNVEF